MAERFRMDNSDEAASAARTRAAFVEQNTALNALRDAKMDAAAMRAKNLETRTEAEQAAAALSLERGDWSDHALRQRNMSELAVERARAEDERRYWQNQPAHHPDPVEALIQSRASEPRTQAWLRTHPADALALATGSDPRRQAKILAADSDARAEGYTPGSTEYLRHVDNFLGGTRGSGSNEQRQRQVRVVKGQASGENELTPGEYRAATEDVCWGNNAPPGKRGEPIGVEEYLKRRAAMRATPGWFDKLD